MGSEKVEIVRGLYEGFRRGDAEAAFEYLDRDIVWVAERIGLPDMDRVYHGHDGVRTFWRQWLSAWEEVAWEMQELSEVEDGRVRVLIHQRNKGRETGIWVEQRPYEMLWTFAEGKIVRMDFRWAEPG